jgi:large subunit ribosomal protein L17
MHRHGFKGRKFGRKSDQRRALIKGLASNLAMNERIETTDAKARELVPYFDKLITKAKKGDLHNRRQVIAKMANTPSAHKLVDEIAPKLKGRTSGYLRIKPTRARQGDNAQLYSVTFVDDLHAADKKADTPPVKGSEPKKAPAKVTTKPVAKKDKK